ncbi:MAG: hypothetical protein ABR958_09315 [Dehalococcoidales bacterium]
MDYAILIAGVSLAISLFVAYLEISRRWRKLYFSVTNVDLVDGLGDELFVVFYLGFVNTASIPKSVYLIDTKLKENFRVTDVQGTPNPELTIKTYRPFGMQCKGCALRFDDVEVGPFDVEPYHSKTITLPLKLAPFDFSHFEHGRQSTMKRIGYFVAYDHKKHVLAKAPIDVPV